MSPGSPLASLFLLVAVAAAAEFPSPFNTEKLTEGFTPAETAVAGFTLPQGFHAQVFAAEPEVQQPIAMTTDPRGRIWVAENYTYAERPTRWEARLRDRIIVLEDRDGDGKSDRRAVFWDEGRGLTSLEVGLGGVWALCPPQLLFIPDRDGDDVPDGPPEVVLDGFSAGATIGHNIANGLKWGPDGWLYGRQGIQDTSAIGRPGAGTSERVMFNCAIWRYHPVRRIAEVDSHGGTNPWGLDYDRHGQFFYTNTVIGHLWHVIPGAYYRRMYGAHLNTHVYEAIEQTADHFHWNVSAERWNDIRSAPLSAITDRSGGGHVHIGALIYQGGTWPEAFHNALLTCNLQGHRVNVDTLHREGGGYVARHAPDFAHVPDKWFRGMELVSGPDGNVYIADWNDTGECHDNDGVHRTSGRIYKVSYGDQRASATDVNRASDRELVDFQSHRNDWFARAARRVLQARSIQRRLSAEPASLLQQLLVSASDPVVRLRALWSLQTIGATNEAGLRRLLDDGSEHVRVWAVRLLAESAGTREPATFAKWQELARADPSGLVRVFLASALQRLPQAQRWPIAMALAAHEEDANDRQQPLIIWYGIESAVLANPVQALELVAKGRLPLVRRLVVRRLAEEIHAEPNPVNLALVIGAKPGVSASVREDILAGLAEGLRGRSRADKPKAWDNFVSVLRSDQASDAARRMERELSILFGSGRAEAELLTMARDTNENPSARRSALRSLVQNPKPEYLATLKEWTKDRVLAPEAVRALALYDDPEIPTLLLELHTRFGRAVKNEMVETLISRPRYARALLQQIREGRLPRDILNAYQARHVRNLGDAELSAMIAATWGELRESPAEKRAEISRWERELTPSAMAKANASVGRAVFDQRCASCHRLHGAGGMIGPDLTGSDRRQLTYLLENIIDPGAVVPKAAQVCVVKLRGGRVLSGMIAEESEQTLTLQTPTERVALARTEIEDLQHLPNSLMPDGLLQDLSVSQVRDLVAYLMSDIQIETAK